MTHQPDDRNPDEPGTGSSEVEPPFDENAAWAEIVAHYGDRPVMGASETVEEDAQPPPPPAPPRPHPRPKNLFDRSYIEANTERTGEASWEDEGHFVPPEPPPLPRLEPRRKLAWIGLFGAPTLLLIAVVFGWSFPSWLGSLLVAGFVGGFVYLIATMPRQRPGDWSGDDGAVL
jgi:hypothetical protein